MYTHIAEETIEANVTEKIETPQWMEANGNVVPESDLFGWNVTHNITHPDYCFVMDEVGGNINQKEKEYRVSVIVM